jgi:hypothetical protein
MGARFHLLATAAAAALFGCSGNNMNTPAPAVSFSAPAGAAAIDLGQSVKLAWSAGNAMSCTASTTGPGGNFSGTVAASGSQSVAPTATGSVSYSLSCTGPGGTGSATSPIVTVSPSILSGLKTITAIGSTDPKVGGADTGFNPYGLAIAPVSSGPIAAGDLIVCNFNDGATNTQGEGTTIVGLHPAPGSTPYLIANSASLKGCSELSLLPDDSIVATAFSANTVPLVTPAGTISNPFSGDSFQGAWGETLVPAAGSQPAALYVSNVFNGSIDRISLSGDAQSAFAEIASGFCGSGSPGTIYAPSGLTYDPAVDTLYVVDTSSNSVVALAGVSAIPAGGITVSGGCSAAPPTPAPTFSGPAAASARVIASGGQLNAPISAALLPDGDLVVGNGDLNNPPIPNLLFEISPALGIVGQPVQLDSGNPGALFGIVATTDGSGGTIIYFNDDNLNGGNTSNFVMSLSQ